MTHSAVLRAPRPVCLAMFWLILLAFAAPAAFGQGMGGGGMGRGGHGGGKGNGNNQQQHNVTAEQAVQPLDGVFSQLPQLKLDLLLKPEQFEAWSAVHYAMRICVDMEKARARRFSGNSSGSIQPPLVFVQDLADNEHAYAAALEDLAGKMEKLTNLLDPRQLTTFNERLQSLVPRESLRDTP